MPPAPRLGADGAGDAMLEIRGLVKRYRDGARPALDGIDLDVPAGQVLALIGPSGAGKSTLIRCVNRLVEPTAGAVRLDGEDLVRLRGRALRRARRRIGMIFQEFALVERLTVMENVLSGRLGYVGTWRALLRRFPAADVDDAFALLADLELTGLENRRADALSGGQRQRVGIARALMQRPRLLLVDEPTASLDPRTARRILRLIVDAAGRRGIAAVLNIHDVPLARRFVARMVGLREGRIVFDGAPAGLRAEHLDAIYGEEDWGADEAGSSAGEDGRGSD